MPVESILTYIKPGFPKDSLSSDAYRTTIEYVGPKTTLAAATPAIKSLWGVYPGLTESYQLDPIEGTTYATLTVVVERKFDTGGESPETGTKLTNETTYEIDWVDIQRSLYEHPKFKIGGSGQYVLTAKDVSALRLWDVEPDENLRKDYKYTIISASGDKTESTLSTNAKMLAKGRLEGIEYWIDKAPVARQSDTWVKGPPPRGTAGQKEAPTGFPNLPTGYEWIRSADRGLRAGGQASWISSTEWIGAKKVLIDVDDIFWTAPT